MNDAKATASADVYAQEAERFTPGFLCPLDVLENEGGPPLDRDIISGYGCDADLTHTDTLMSHEGLALSVGYSMNSGHGEEFGYEG